jgi:hypothetical protein
MTEQNLVPPYVGWGVFKNTVETLAQTSVPTGPLDRRVLDFLSGADHGALLSGMRFLGLVDGEKKASQLYRDLVAASKDATKFCALLHPLLDEKYKPILGRVDLQHGTITEVERAFKDAGVTQGQMLTKTVRFFVKAYTECGVALSAHITKSAPKGSRTTSRANGERTRSRTKTSDTTGHQPLQNLVATDPVPEGFARMAVLGLDGAHIQYPKELTEQQCTMLEASILMLRMYAKYMRTGQVTVEELKEALAK